MAAWRAKDRIEIFLKMGKMLEMAKRSHPAGTECDRVGRESSRILPEPKHCLLPAPSSSADH